MNKFPRSSILATSLAISSIIFIATDAHAAFRNYKNEMNYKGEVSYRSLPTNPVFGCADKELYDGLYLGAGVGYDVYKFRQNTSAMDADGITASINPAISAKGWNGSVFAGYGCYYEWFYFGAEIMANDGNADGSYAVTTDILGAASYSVKVKSRYSYGGGFLPGIKVNDATLFYGRVGYVKTSFRMMENASAPTGHANLTATKSGDGFNYGLGLETAVARNISLRGEYTYTSYSTIRSSVATKFTPSNNQFVLSAIYHFA